MIVKALKEELNLSQELVKEGFSHAYKAGELLQEVKNMVGTKQGFDEWVEKNLKRIDEGLINICLKLFNGEKVKVEVSSKEKGLKGEVDE
ncbi:MAG: hypothetical protein WCY37_05535 [Candidatus Dojkabacteria bacterium]